MRCKTSWTPGDGVVTLNTSLIGRDTAGGKILSGPGRCAGSLPPDRVSPEPP